MCSRVEEDVVKIDALRESVKYYSKTWDVARGYEDGYRGDRADDNLFSVYELPGNNTLHPLYDLLTKVKSLDPRMAMRSLTLLVWHNIAVLTILVDVEAVINPVIVGFKLSIRQRVTISFWVNLNNARRRLPAIGT